jgi:hypothetical protein
MGWNQILSEQDWDDMENNSNRFKNEDLDRRGMLRQRPKTGIKRSEEVQ